MKKSEAKFNKNAKKQIDDLARKNEQISFWEKSNPIFIPKRKKFKK
jgi:hypothetical protein